MSRQNRDFEVFFSCHPRHPNITASSVQAIFDEENTACGLRCDQKPFYVGTLIFSDIAQWQEVMKIPLVKLKAILLYLTNNTDTRFLGKVKLMKLFYFLDFMHVKMYGTPITYDAYINLEHGPIPSAIKNLIDTADDDIDSSVLADTIHFEYPPGIRMCRILPSRKFTEKDRKLFSETELEILQKVCSLYGDKNTQFVKEASHREAPWNQTNFLDPIPYELAAKDPDSAFDEKEISLALKIV